MRLFRIPSYRPPDELPSRAASNWLMLSVACAVAPHVVRLPVWLTLVVALGLAWRYAIDNHAWRVPPRWLRVILLVAVCVGIARHFDAFLGREPGVALLTAAVGLKLLEIRVLRDYLITVFLTYFLLVGAFLYSQSMTTAVYGIAVVLLSTASLAMLNNAQGLGGLRLWGLLGRIVLYGLPICLVMYLFFPRIQGSLWGLPEDAFSQTGMTDEVSPGSIARLSNNDTPAFRVAFEGAPPPPEDRYWRVYVLSDYDDGTWDRLTMTAFDGGKPGEFEGAGPVTDYTVTLEPHHKHWLPALDLPVTVPEVGEPRHGYLVGADRAVNRLTRYTLSSQQPADTGPLNSIELRVNRDMDGGPSARVANLIDQWSGFAPREKAEAALTLFREQPYRYTLSPPPLSGDRIDQFLFETRSGYCEHYASAFVGLMRWAGVPARLLAGYQGGEWNDTGGYLTVYQADAHAWAEVWLEGRGWTRFDPTAAIAPERIEMGAETLRRLLEEGASPGELSNAQLRNLMSRSWIQRQLLEARWAWDNLNYVWNMWVMGYGPQVQREFLRWLGFDTPTWTRMVATLAAGVAILMIASGILLTHRRTRLDPVVRAYRRALRRAARAGWHKEPWEGPRDFQQRLERGTPELARRFKPVTEMYVALRYAEDSRYGADSLRLLAAKV